MSGFLDIAIPLDLRNVHEISSTTFITQNFYFRLDDLVRRIVILRNEQDHPS